MNQKNNTIYILSPYPYGTAPSQRFRYEQYLERFKQDGFSVELFPFIDEKGWGILYQKGYFLQKGMAMLRGFWRRILLMFKLRKADFIFVHREMSQFGPPIFEWFTAKILKKKYIYDFDDAIWLPNYSESNARMHWVKCYWKIPYCIRWASQVTVGNLYLANYARKYNENVTVIPTTIDMENHHNRTIDYQKEQMVIGWTGSHSTMHYLTDVCHVIKKLEEEFDFTFMVISNKKPDFDLKSLVYKSWNKNTEIDDLCSFSIGIMPLKEDKWSKGKCGFKALQYMSLGIPSVISPVGVNMEIIEDGKNGFLASDSEKMYESLKCLLLDSELRRQVGLAGQETIRNRYSVASNYIKYEKLFCD